MIETEITKILQVKQLDMFNELIRIFNKYNIKYSLAFGTLLGCIRHKGYIPWDDDIDIHILGEDYIKFKKAMQEEKQSFLKLDDPYLCKNYPYGFPKVVYKNSILIEESLINCKYNCGVYIDIFPIFKVRKGLYGRIDNIIRYLYYGTLRARYGNNKVLSILSRFISINFLRNIVYRIYSKKCEKNFLCTEPYCFDKNKFLDYDIVSCYENGIFELLDVKIFSEYDKYLKKYYGDYMKLPQSKDRISNHHFAKLQIDNQNIVGGE